MRWRYTVARPHRRRDVPGIQADRCPVPPFVIFALPRSRTAWLSQFLTYGDWRCEHDALAIVRSVPEALARLAVPRTGFAETGAAPWWRFLPAGTRVVLVRRPIAEVVASAMRIWPFDPDVLANGLRRLDRKLDQIAMRWPGALTVRFADLAGEEACARVFERCLPYRHDAAWWRAWTGVNVQADAAAIIRSAAARRAELVRLASDARIAALATMRAAA